MPCGREIRLRRVKSLRRRGDLFHFTFRISGKFHNVWRTLFHIRHKPNISLVKYSCRFNSTLEFCNIIFFVTSLQKSRMRKRSGFLLFTSSLLTLHSSAHSGFSEVISNSEKWKSALQCFVLPFINNIVVSTLFICIYRIFLAHWFCDTITQNIPLYSNALLCYNKIILLTAKKDFIET